MILFKNMSINIQVNKNDKESTAGLIRRFTKRVRGSGMLSRVRGIRYHERQVSDYVQKKKTLKRLKKKTEYEKMLKLGKIIEQNKNKFVKRK